MTQTDDLTLFRELINRSSDCLSILDISTGRYVYVNNMTCAATGYTRKELLARRVADIDPTAPESWDPSWERNLRKTRRVYVREGLIRHKNGSIKLVEISSSLVRLPRGDYMVATARDITDRARVIEGLRTAQAKLEQDVRERTAELARANALLKTEIAECARTGTALQESEKQLRRKAIALERKNIALSEMLKQIEWEKRTVMKGVVKNVEENLIPLLERMRLSGGAEPYIALMKDNLRNLTTRLGRPIAENRARLTSREAEIATMLRSGLTSKEISRLLNVTERAAEWHRHNIRKKLGIVGRKQDLRSILSDL